MRNKRQSECMTNERRPFCKFFCIPEPAPNEFDQGSEAKEGEDDADPVNSSVSVEKDLGDELDQPLHKAARHCSPRFVTSRTHPSKNALLFSH
jgi:hypothetical protein